MNLPTNRLSAEKIRRQVGSLALQGLFQGASRVGQMFPYADPERYNIEVTRDIPYLPTGNNAHTLDIYRPRDAQTPLPVVFYIHGGGFQILSKDTHWVMALLFAQQGYLVVNINYRLAPQHPFPAAIDDTCTAYAWAINNVHRYGGNPEHIIVAGESAGANLATSLTIATTFERPEPYANQAFQTGIVPTAVIPACGILQVSDVERFSRRRPLPRWLCYRLEEISTAYLTPTLPTNLDLADPLVFLESNTQPTRPLPPFFAPVGTRDPLLDDTRRLHTALQQRNVPSTATYYPREVHAFHAFTWRKQAQQCWTDKFTFLNHHT